MNSCNFTNKANSHTPKVEIHTYKTKGMPFLALCWESEAILSRKLRPGYPGRLECSYGKIFIPVSEISVAKTEISPTGQPGFSY